ncbi:substrate-binding domain-containing protein [Brevibacillus sp. NRS-1366]|uniref:substrate-binding domain-containing protein n=1 Tax=Brevibacillus sp. NRS-1366 TaxID=3233899 RepID=UPI003D243E9B
MNENLIGKIIGCIIAFVLLAFVGFAVLVFSLFSTGTKFYTPLTIVVTGVLVVFTVLRIFAPTIARILNRSLAVFFILATLAVIGFEIKEAYVNSIPTVSEQDFDLEEYRPFGENTKAVKLDQPSTLKLDSDLPRLDGATALYPLYASFAQAVYPKKQYDQYEGEVMGNTTPRAYENLIEGKADIIFVAAPSKQQLNDAKRQGVELKLTPIGREAFVFFVNAANPVKGLSTEQIQKIYSGQITNWQEVGGQNEQIRAFQRPENSGSQTMLQKVMAGQELMTPPQDDVVSGMGGIIERTSNYKNYNNAIGYSFLFFATEMVKNGNIRLLEVDGVMPDKSTIVNKEYPLAAEFYAVTAGSTNPNVSRLIEWILSGQGQSLVEETGYTPVAAAKTK